MRKIRWLTKGRVKKSAVNSFAMVAVTGTAAALAAVGPAAASAGLRARPGRHIEVAAGLSNAEIAGRLVLAEATVKTHAGRMLSKLGLRDRVQAVVYAYEHGLVRPQSRPWESGRNGT